MGKALYYCIGKSRDDATADISTINSMLYEAFLHGEKFFNVFRQEAIDFGIDSEKLPTFDYLVTKRNEDSFQTWQ
jgi:hypothetical protein